MKPEVKILEIAQDLARASAEDFQHAVNQVAKSNRDFYIAWSGGSAPALFFQMLPKQLYQNSIFWQNAHFFFINKFLLVVRI
jgi:6-phosphogluconolactonase/glucosamine-6-phosphate isomerase/deaminase